MKKKKRQHLTEKKKKRNKSMSEINSTTCKFLLPKEERKQ